MIRLPARWLWLAGLLALIALAAACGGGGGEEGPPAPEVKTDFGVTDTEIILGQHSVRTGSFAGVYALIAPAQRAYFRYINDTEGGVCGRQIVLKVEDDQYSPAVALEMARKLVEQDRILAFIGNLGTPPTTGSADYIKEQGVPNLFLSSGASKWGDYQKWPQTIGFIPDYYSDARILAMYLNENFPGTTAGVLYQNDDFGKDGYDGFKDTFQGQIVEVQSYEATATEVTSQLANLRDAGPDILLLYSLPVFSAQVFRYMAANDWYPQVVMSYVNPPSIVADLAGGESGMRALAGTIVNNYLLDPVVNADHPAIKRHREIMEKYGGPVPNFLSVYGQALAETVVETLKIACQNADMTRQGVLRAAESITGFRPSVLYPGIEINLGPQDHFAIQALVPSEIRADRTTKPLTEPISVE